MLTYSMDARGQESLYEYLYRCIRADIEQGAIAAGEKLPSKRALADHLGVSVITVEGAYTQLVAEGYVRAEPRRGYFACDVFSAGQQSGGAHVRKTATVASRQRTKVASATAVKSPENSDDAIASHKNLKTAAPLIADLTGGTAVSGLFPYSTWAKAVRDALSWETEATLIGECAGVGSSRLRSAIADYLKAFRGMDVDPECIVVGAGSQVLDGLIIQLLGVNMLYAAEDPGYPRLSRLYNANGASLVHVPLDEEGIDVASLNDSGANVVHLMPSHQYPTGLVTPISRRYELLGWAAQSADRYIIEDDYDCEFRLAGKPIPSLQSIDTTDSVIYTNTFTKSLGPAFRIAYMVLPHSLMQRYRERLGFYSSTVSAIDQLALARFIENGDYERNINRMRTHYRDVRNEFIAALRASDIGPRITISAEDSGLHFIMTVEGLSGAEGDRRFVRRAAEEGVKISPLADFCANLENAANYAHQFMVAYSGLAEGSILKVVRAFERAARV